MSDKKPLLCRIGFHSDRHEVIETLGHARKFKIECQRCGDEETTVTHL